MRATIRNCIHHLVCNAHVLETESENDLNAFPSLGVWLENGDISKHRFEAAFSDWKLLFWTSTALIFSSIAFFSNLTKWSSLSESWRFLLWSLFEEKKVSRPVMTSCNRLEDWPRKVLSTVRNARFLNWMPAPQLYATLQSELRASFLITNLLLFWVRERGRRAVLEKIRPLIRPWIGRRIRALPVRPDASWGQEKVKKGL